MQQKASSKVQFHFIQKLPSLKNRQQLKQFLEELFRREKKKLEHLNYIFCSDDFLLKINQDFLQHDYYTDIISFDLSEKGRGIRGEIYISVDRLRENAQNFGSTQTEEAHRLLFHGALHLCGYKDKSQKDQLQMRAKENEYLEKYLK